MSPMDLKQQAYEAKDHLQDRAEELREAAEHAARGLHNAVPDVEAVGKAARRPVLSVPVLAGLFAAVVIILAVRRSRRAEDPE